MRRRRHLSKTLRGRNAIDENNFVDAKAKDLIEYWSLTILLRLNGHSEFVNKNGDLTIHWKS